MIKNKDKLKLFFIFFAVVITFTYISKSYFINILIPLIKAAYLIIELILIGFYISTLTKKEEFKDSILTYTGLGIIFTSLFFYSISIMKILNSITISIYFLIPILILSILIFDKNKKNKIKSVIIIFTNRAPFEYLIFLIPFIYASLPPTFYDSLVYHLGIPNLYLNSGGFIQTPQFMFANMFIYYEITLIPAVYLGDLVPRLFHFLLGIIFLLSLIDFGEDIFNIKKRKTLLILLLSLPLTLFLLTTVKSDLISALFVFLGVKTYYKKSYFYSALFWGFAVGIKLFSVIGLLIFFILMVIKQRKLHPKRHILMGIVTITTILPLLIKNYILCNNPFFPFFSKYFPSEFWDSSRFLITRSEVGSYYHSFLDLFKAPFSFSFEMHGSGGIIGPVFLVFLPFLIFYKVKKKFLLLFSLLLIFIGPLFSDFFRYIYIAFLLLSIYVILVYQKENKKVLSFIIFIIIFINFVTGISTLESIYSAKDIYFFKKSIDEYKLKFFPTYKIYSTINNITAKSDKILIGGEGRGFYLKRPYIIADAEDYSIFKKYLKYSNTKEQFFESIRNDGFDYLVFNLREFKRLQSYKRLDKNEEKKLFNFLQNTKPFKQEKYLYIYKLRK